MTELKVLAPSRKLSPALVKMFHKVMPGQVEDIRAAVLAADLEQTRQTAHKAKGGCLAIGAQQMAETCKSLQHLGEQESFDTDLANQLITQLNIDFDALCAALEAEG